MFFTKGQFSIDVPIWAAWFRTSFHSTHGARAAGTNCHKRGDLKQQECVGLQFWEARSLTSRCQQGLASSGGSRGEFPLPLPHCPWWPATLGVTGL